MAKLMCPAETVMVHVDRILERVSGLASALKLASLRPEITACRNHCAGNRRIDVFVLRLENPKDSVGSRRDRKGTIPFALFISG